MHFAFGRVRRRIAPLQTRILVIGTHYLKVGACASSRLRFSLRENPSHCRSTLGGQARPFDIDSSVYVSVVV